MNTGKDKLERLTRAWYGSVFVAAVLGFFMMGSGIIGTLVGLVISLALVAFVGNRLAAGSGAMRLFCLVLGVLGVAGHSYMTYRSVAGSWSLYALGTGTMSIIYVVMNFKSLRVLTSSDVRAHFKA